MKLTKSYLTRIINEELSRVLLEEFDKIDAAAHSRKHWETREEEEEEEKDELDLLGMQFGLDDDDPQMAWARDGVEEAADPDDWMKKADDDIEKRGTKGKCTPITKKGCTGRAKALAKTFKKIGRERKAKDHPGKRDY
jgi:hypothetical protein